MNNTERIDALDRDDNLPFDDWYALIDSRTRADEAYAATRAHKIALSRFGAYVYLRGIVEFTNICKNDCLYCGIRRSNTCAERYRMSEDEILACCETGHRLGFRTFVLQGGEDPYFTDERMAKIVSDIRGKYPDCAITLSLGERSRASYQRLFDAGADRYLLRHETADEAHYGKLHPPALSWKNRMDCLAILKEIGYQTGCGMMIGAPYQTNRTLAKDMAFIASFKPQMIGLGPFIPAAHTPFSDQPAGTLKDTLFFLSLCRIALKDVLLPATTALATIEPKGREKGILAGANVVMPNLSPTGNRKKYMLYDNKIGTADEAQDGHANLERQLADIGYAIKDGRCDYKVRFNA